MDELNEEEMKGVAGGACLGGGSAGKSRRSLPIKGKVSLGHGGGHLVIKTVKFYNKPYWAGMRFTDGDNNFAIGTNTPPNSVIKGNWVLNPGHCVVSVDNAGKNAHASFSCRLWTNKGEMWIDVVNG